MKPLWSSTVLTKDHTVVDAFGPLSQEDKCPYTWSCQMPQNLVPCTTRPRVTAWSSMSPSTDKVFLYWSQSIKSRRDDHFLKCTDTYARLLGSPRIRIMKRNIKYPGRNCSGQEWSTLAQPKPIFGNWHQRKRYKGIAQEFKITVLLIPREYKTAQITI